MLASERERERGGERERERERETERERDTDRQTDIHTDKYVYSHTQKPQNLSKCFEINKEFFFFKTVQND